MYRLEEYTPLTLARNVKLVLQFGFCQTAQLFFKHPVHPIQSIIHFCQNCPKCISFSSTLLRTALENRKNLDFDDSAQHGVLTKVVKMK
jgi:hypothetical protein